RHTRSKRDWSSDVCSSDLSGLGARRRHRAHGGDGFGGGAERQGRTTDAKEQVDGQGGGVGSGGEGDGEQRHPHAEQAAGSHDKRSEERRVGGEGREGGARE